MTVKEIATLVGVAILAVVLLAIRYAKALNDEEAEFDRAFADAVKAHFTREERRLIIERYERIQKRREGDGAPNGAATDSGHGD